MIWPRYRLTERGQFIVTKLEDLDEVQAYRTMLDMPPTIESSQDNFHERVTDDDVKDQIAQQSETDPYVDPFGCDVI